MTFQLQPLSMMSCSTSKWVRVTRLGHSHPFPYLWLPRVKRHKAQGGLKVTHGSVIKQKPAGISRKLITFGVWHKIKAHERRHQGHKRGQRWHPHRVVHLQRLHLAVAFIESELESSWKGLKVAATFASSDEKRFHLLLFSHTDAWAKASKKY